MRLPPLTPVELTATEVAATLRNRCHTTTQPPPPPPPGPRRPHLPTERSGSVGRGAAVVECLYGIDTVPVPWRTIVAGSHGMGGARTLCESERSVVLECAVTKNILRKTKCLPKKTEPACGKTRILRTFWS
ncbi:hypothetical protein GGX14DRAFT_575849 [Mycena pura]|uniref:Uncharacterized protein n=1 Tax=Mycena pura TaxID=153505 RepID=A0AAD6Y5I2_9AGAR|nr:hypothetical protein GGX14DRAFT_575849 [Mycena pura]